MVAEAPALPLRNIYRLSVQRYDSIIFGNPSPFYYRKDREEMEDKQTSVFTSEQREAILKALDDPEKMDAILELLRDAGLLL